MATGRQHSGFAEMMMIERRTSRAAWILAGLLLVSLAPSSASAKGSRHATGTATHHAGQSKAAPRVARDAKGKIARSSHERAAFNREHPCPSTGKTSGDCPGYAVDHVTPLKRGGADRPENMQWQKAADARAKDKTE